MVRLKVTIMSDLMRSLRSNSRPASDNMSEKPRKSILIRVSPGSLNMNNTAMTRTKKVGKRYQFRSFFLGKPLAQYVNKAKAYTGRSNKRF
jgi:hypothetical protein